MEKTSKQMRRSDVWGYISVRQLYTEGAPLIEGGSLTESRVESVLNGSDLLEKFSTSQLRTKINYERLLRTKEREREQIR